MSSLHERIQECLEFVGGGDAVAGSAGGIDLSDPNGDRFLRKLSKGILVGPVVARIERQCGGTIRPQDRKNSPPLVDPFWAKLPNSLAVQQFERYRRRPELRRQTGEKPVELSGNFFGGLPIVTGEGQPFVLDPHARKSRTKRFEFAPPFAQKRLSSGRNREAHFSPLWSSDLCAVEPDIEEPVDGKDAEKVGHRSAADDRHIRSRQSNQASQCGFCTGQGPGQFRAGSNRGKCTVVVQKAKQLRAACCPLESVLDLLLVWNQGQSEPSSLRRCAIRAMALMILPAQR